VALSVASHLDLNDLHALSTTCRTIHSSLIQYCRQLKAHSLRCTHDARPLLADVLASRAEEGDADDDAAQEASNNSSRDAHAQMVAALMAWPRMTPHIASSVRLAGKVGACARDLVAPCRRCGRVVCRNCASKPPSDIYLKDRFRRLCRACLEAPLAAHLRPLVDRQDRHDGLPRWSASSSRSVSTSSSSTTSDSEDREAAAAEEDIPTGPLTSAAFLRGPCTCPTRGVFLCGPCGHCMRTADITYKRVWTWRSRYSTHIGGGLGTGLGVGNQGQKCGRGEHCLESGRNAVCWVEIDCADGQAGRDHDGHAASDGHGLHGGDRQAIVDSMSDKPGYLSQEIEGIGGVVKKKVKMRVKVGATVWEYQDERESGEYLEREASGQERSWCGWCGRVCLGEMDRREVAL